jgi:hypothetical protein
MSPILMRCFDDSSMREEIRRGTIVSAMIDHPGILLDHTRTMMSSTRTMMILIVAYFCNSALAYTEPDLIMAMTRSDTSIANTAIPASGYHPTTHIYENIQTSHTERAHITIPRKNLLLFHGVSMRYDAAYPQR